jgi:hypothetical protein
MICYQHRGCYFVFGITHVQVFLVWCKLGINISDTRSVFRYTAACVVCKNQIYLAVPCQMFKV